MSIKRSENFYNAVQAYVDDDTALLVNLTTTAGLQVEFAERLFKSSLTEHGTAKDGEEGKAEQMQRQVATFTARLEKIKKLCAKRAPQAEFAGKRLDAALQFYEQALKALDNQDFAEAERLARACHLDLDFARQLVFSAETAKYADL